MMGKEPVLLATVVNTTIAELIDANLAYRTRQAHVTTDFMQREFDRAETELRAHQRSLSECQLDSNKKCNYLAHNHIRNRIRKDH